MPKTIDAEQTNSKSQDSSENSRSIPEEVQATLGRNSRLIAVISHLASIVLTASTVLNPLWFLLLYLFVQDKFIKENAREILNFEITIWLTITVMGALTALFFFLIITIPIAIVTGLITLLAILAQFVFPIFGAVEANQGKVYRYPFTLRLVK